MIKSAGLVLISDNKLLLIKPTGIQSLQQWSIPKGLVNEGESIIDTAIRETYEETGLMVPRDKIDAGKRSLISYIDQTGKLKKVIFYFVIHMTHTEYLSWGGGNAYDQSEVEQLAFFSKKQAKLHLYWKQWPIINHLDETKFDLQDIDNHINNGLINKVKHPQLPLWIYNITSYCKKSHCWNYTTTSCRGLILDESGVVIARPFKKFFEQHDLYDEIVSILPEQKQVAEKIDGALGILYWYNDVPYITCKHRFGHYLELPATDLLYNKYGAVLQKYKTLTLLFEIIAAKYPFTINYYYDDIILIGAIETTTGKEYDVNRYRDDFPLPAMDTQTQKTEGYVAVYNDATRVKIKSAYFLKRYQDLKAMKYAALQSPEYPDTLSFEDKDNITRYICLYQLLLFQQEANMENVIYWM